MKTFTFAASLAIALTLITSESCSFAIGNTPIKPSKKYVTKKVEIKNINSISASTSVDVVYTQSQGKAYAEVYAPDNIIPYIKVQQSGNKLKVNYDFPKGKILVLYCDRGGASLLLARQLAKLGYCTRAVIGGFGAYRGRNLVISP